MIDELAARLSNWGRWGPDDEIGTLNYITPEKVARACALVSSGEVIPLGVPLERNGPQATAPRRYNPIHFIDELPTDYVLPGEVGVADDVMVLPLQATTQWDSLAHVSHRGKLYGGRSHATVTSHGAQVNSIRGMSGKVVSRGILADLPALLGVPVLEPGHAISPEELEAALGRAGLAPESGDILLVRTGWLEKCRPLAWQDFHADAPGLGIDVLAWLHEHEVTAVATDTPSLEVKPFSVEGVGVPFHAIAIVYMGLLLGEIFDLGELARRCAADGRYEFLFVAPPLPVTGGIGSPANPYAIK